MELLDAFSLGASIEYAKRSRWIKPYVKGEDYLLDDLKRLKSKLEKHDMNHRLISETSEWIKKLEKNYKEKQYVTETDAINLSLDASSWDDLAGRLLLERPVLELIKTGALNQKALLDTSKGEPSAFFEEKTWNGLSRIEKSDFSNAAKCLLAGIPTPAAMVALRGAEATVKKYHEFKIGKPSKRKRGVKWLKN